MIDQVTAKLKEHLITGARVLDVGFGTGRLAFRFFHELLASEMTGIEYRSLEEMQNIDCQHAIYEKHELKLHQNRVIDKYKFYNYLISEKFNPLSETDFQKSVSCNYNTSFDELATDQKYDVVVLFNVLHYTLSGDYRQTIEKASSLLNENGLIAISHKETETDQDEDKTNGRQFISKKDLVNYLQEHFEILLDVDVIIADDEWSDISDDDSRDNGAKRLVIRPKSKK